MTTEILYRRIAVILMMTAFFVQTFSSCLIVADYYTDKTSFVKDCVNKAQPELHCNGKCQLQKQIANEEKKDQQSPQRKDNKNEVVLSAPTSGSFIPAFFTEKPTCYSPGIVGKEIKMSRSLLRPPIA